MQLLALIYELLKVGWLAFPGMCGREDFGDHYDKTLLFFFFHN